MSWRLTPGQALGEVDLSERLGDLRTPVREALSRLTADGLTQPHNGRGVVVSATSSEDVRALNELRTPGRPGAQAGRRARRPRDLPGARGAALADRGDAHRRSGPRRVLRARGPHWTRRSRRRRAEPLPAAGAGQRAAAPRAVRRLSMSNLRRLAVAAAEHVGDRPRSRRATPPWPWPPPRPPQKRARQRPCSTPELAAVPVAS
ncbi:GntR family transcriptional regulator [Kocuria rhizophila]|nr:GntR family transcriptional regulator [Kocuria rhizophila]